LMLIGELNRRSATEGGCALIAPALKSRAKLIAAAAAEEVLLDLFLKGHKATSKFKASLTR
jgi:hypothetical protein